MGRKEIHANCVGVAQKPPNSSMQVDVFGPPLLAFDEQSDNHPPTQPSAVVHLIFGCAHLVIIVAYIFPQLFSKLLVHQQVYQKLLRAMFPEVVKIITYCLLLLTVSAYFRQFAFMIRWSCSWCNHQVCDHWPGKYVCAQYFFKIFLRLPPLCNKAHAIGNQCYLYLSRVSHFYSLFFRNFIKCATCLFL